MANPYLIRALYGPKPTPDLGIKSLMRNEKNDCQATNRTEVLQHDPQDSQRDVSGYFCPGSDATAQTEVLAHSSRSARQDVSVHLCLGSENTAQTEVLAHIPQSTRQDVFEHLGSGNKASSRTALEQSLIELLYGDSAMESSTNPNLTHPERQRLMESEEPFEHDELCSTQPKGFQPTESNAVPLGTRLNPLLTMKMTAPTTSLFSSKQPSSSNASSIYPIIKAEDNSSTPMHPVARCLPTARVYYDQPSSPRVSSTDPVSKAEDNSGILRYPAERYLPPPGVYYDQTRLPGIFGGGFFKVRKCIICWGPHHVKEGDICAETCKICGTTTHPDKPCSMLYCSPGWYAPRKHHNGFADISACQLRPTKPEIVVLLQRGLIKECNTRRDIIVPNVRHPLVQQFYCDKALPVSLQTKSFVHDDMSNVNNARSTIHHTMSTKKFKPAQSGNSINRNLNPGHKSMNVSGISSLIKLEPMTSTTLQQNGAKKYYNEDNISDEDENKIQQLEDELLKLKMENIAKDREIRRLKIEIEQLRGNSYQTGSKRLRM